jgi:phenylpropionate dioxygenase-like ring-hydroxylating dioxygenase large terminal subunit
VSLKNYWYIAAECGELRAKPLRRTLFGTPLVLFRNASGAASTLEDRCAHRNMQLSLGEVTNGCIRCPYHGWRFSSEGDCVSVPSLGSRGSSHRVRSYPTREQDGYIWVFAGENPAAEDCFRFPHMGKPGWTTFRMKTRFDGSVESCLENFLDCPHTVYVHQGWFRTHDSRELKARVRTDCNSVEVEFEGEPIGDSLVSRLFFPSGRSLRHTDRFIMPNVSRVDYDFGPDRHFIITSQCTPIEDRVTQVYTAITYRFGRIGSLIRWALEPVCRKIIRQDVDVLRTQAVQIDRFGGERFAHVETDLVGLSIHSMRRRAERSEPTGIERGTEREISICF